ncbi:alpha/beta hydrolase family protein [Stella humosa]|uniref:Alpha/beta hydrolase family protein n=1 Tax=Stella humosa TaxID=94 RepID=A0A3N1MEV5_9PROT|nr:alpha/beta hydrolase [Stella humosa]ROQ01829.1 alpha/beta hydrolase family protein [Stella humosa]BBK32216.1 alpha/beta hydrolase [Stella humosa]
MTQPLDPAVLPAGIRSRLVPGINGLAMHMLEAGYEGEGRPALLLLHGFPELAYSWRKVMLPLAAAGYHVIAPDQRGYGRTTGWDADYDGDLGSFRFMNLLRDAIGLVSALGHCKVSAVIGHDFGASVAAYAALARPDLFGAMVLMSAPFAGAPSIPFDTLRKPQPPAATADIHAALAALDRPRKHYQWYYSERQANADMWHPPQGLHAFLRGYYHFKSADWKANQPYRLAGWTAAELAKMPTYYIMDRDRGMAETVAAEMPSPAEVAACGWLTEAEMAVYAGEFARTGFQGGLQWYRCRTDGRFDAELEVFAGKTIDIPSAFIAGRSDWGIYQRPGAIEAMQEKVCTRMLGCHLIEGAGHWVQQEQPAEVSRLLLAFLKEAGV